MPGLILGIIGVSTAYTPPATYPVAVFWSHEADMPVYDQANRDANAVLTKPQNTPGLVVADELATLKATLQQDFDSSSPLLNQ